MSCFDSVSLSANHSVNSEEFIHSFGKIFTFIFPLYINIFIKIINLFFVIIIIIYCHGHINKSDKIFMLINIIFIMNADKSMFLWRTEMLKFYLPSV